jgi:hypothetical protein
MDHLVDGAAAAILCWAGYIAKHCWIFHAESIGNQQDTAPLLGRDKHTRYRAVRWRRQRLPATEGLTQSSTNGCASRYVMCAPLAALVLMMRCRCGLIVTSMSSRLHQRFRCQDASGEVSREQSGVKTHADSRWYCALGKSDAFSEIESRSVTEEGPRCHVGHLERSPT